MTNQSSPESAEALKPCPFCGSQVALSILEDEPGEIISAWVHCSCGVEIHERRTEAEAAMQWNSRAAHAQQPASPENADRERMATRLDEHAIRYANDYGYNVAADLKRAAEMLRIPAQSTLEDMARLSASEVACYRWPEDTAEHRAMRAAFCDGAAHTAVTSTEHQPVENKDGGAA